MTVEIESSTLSGLVKVLERRSTRFWAGSAILIALAAVAAATGLGLLAGGRGALVALTVAVFFALAALVLVGVVIRLARVVADTRARQVLHAVDDDLTGLSNRRTFTSQATRVLAYHQRYRLEVSVLFIDIDHFKAVNDQHGHGEGDRVIQHLAQVLRASIREFDLHCRYGGEEFVLLLPNASQREGLRVGERIREEVALPEGPGHVPYTVSVGLATSRAMADDPLRDLLERSDAALYRAKRSGRNRVVVDEGGGLLEAI